MFLECILSLYTNLIRRLYVHVAHFKITLISLGNIELVRQCKVPQVDISQKKQLTYDAISTQFYKQLVQNKEF